MDVYLERTAQAIDSATAGMTIADLARGPQGKWSTAQTLEHLSLAFSSTVKSLRRVIQDGTPAPRRQFSQFARTLVLIEFGYMPEGRQAPKFTLPRGMAAEDVLPSLRQHLKDMDAVISECERRFGSTTRFGNHPVFGPLTARQWRRFHWVHTRHHMKQIRRIRSQFSVSTSSDADHQR